MELTSPHKHIRNIYMWNNSHGKLTGNRQKNSYITKDAREIYT